MSDTKNGGSAFPTSHSPDYPNEISGGMTLRDYFAAKALQSLVGSIYTPGMKMSGKDGAPITESTIAEQAYHFADAMLTERAK